MRNDIRFLSYTCILLLAFQLGFNEAFILEPNFEDKESVKEYNTKSFLNKLGLEYGLLENLPSEDSEFVPEKPKPRYGGYLFENNDQDVFQLRNLVKREQIPTSFTSSLIRLCLDCLQNEFPNRKPCSNCLNNLPVKFDTSKRQKPSSKYWYSRAGR